MATQELRDLQRVRLPVIAGAALANRKPVTYRGITYASITGLATAYGMYPWQVSRYLKAGKELKTTRYRGPTPEFGKTEMR